MHTAPQHSLAGACRHFRESRPSATPGICPTSPCRTRFSRGFPREARKRAASALRPGDYGTLPPTANCGWRTWTVRMVGGGDLQFGEVRNHLLVLGRRCHGATLQGACSQNDRQSPILNSHLFTPPWASASPGGGQDGIRGGRR